jgi:hypothetical protein
MSRRGWPFVITFGGFLALSNFGVSQTPNHEPATTPSPPIKEQLTKGTNREISSAYDSALPVRVIESAADSEHTREREAKSDEHDAKDLKAQERAANAAEKQILPTWAAAILTAFGTGLLVWNLFETRKSNKISEDTAKRQLRAYVYVVPQNDEHFSWDKHGRFQGCRLAIRNLGVTPAYKVRHAFVAEILPGGENEIHKWPEPIVKDSDFVLHSGEVGSNFNVIINDPDHAHINPQCASPAKINAVMGGDSSIWVWGVVKYEDAFQDHHETHFRYFIGRHQIRDGSLGLLAHGNHAT